MKIFDQVMSRKRHDEFEGITSINIGIYLMPVSMKLFIQHYSISYRLIKCTGNPGCRANLQILSYFRGKYGTSKPHKYVG